MSEPSLRDQLEARGLFAKKAFGQHFLLDLNLTAKIVRLAGVEPGTPVIEVGPGPGGLTRPLLEAGASPLIAIERDRRFVEHLRDLEGPSDGRLQLIEADALGVDEAGLLAEAGAAGPALIVSNLPYNVATPLLVKWLKAGAWRGPMTLMFQAEVAERCVARPGQDAYGRLAVLVAAVMQARIVLHVPARAFVPPPKVESAVVRFDPLAQDAAFADLTALEHVTQAAFGQRRKMLRGALKSLGEAEALLEAAGIEPTARAEEIAPAGFFALATAWRRRIASKRNESGPQA
jgi:16S rRNA (adenine1518-N6/adenine1519-N6)-dimethyltransferase